MKKIERQLYVNITSNILLKVLFVTLSRLNYTSVDNLNKAIRKTIHSITNLELKESINNVTISFMYNKIEALNR